MLLIILFIVIAALLFVIMSNSGKQTAAVQRLERRIDAQLPAETFSPNVIAAAMKPGMSGLIGGMKIYRAETGAGVDEAKAAIDGLRAKLGIK